MRPQAILLRQGISQNKPLEEVGSLSSLDFAPSGWFFSMTLLGGIVHVKTLLLQIDAPFRVELSMGPQYPRVFMLPCNGSTEQSLMHDPASGYIKLSADQNSCLAIGKDKDVASGTPAVELQPCGDQKWQFDADTGNIHPSGESQKCVDVDASDRGAEIYPCGHLQANQCFNFTNDGRGFGHHTGNFRERADGTCMTVVHNPATLQPTRVTGISQASPFLLFM